MSESEKFSSPIADLSNEQLCELLKFEYENADNLCKEVEKFRDEAGVPALNELRYAGYHAIVFLSSNGNSRDQLISGVNHCRRASYEASEAGILAALELLGEFKADYKDVAISDVIPTWPNILRRADEIKAEVSRARQTEEDRRTDHDEFMAAFRELRGFCTEAEYSRDDLAKKINDKRTDTRRFILTIAVTVVIGIFGVAASVNFGAIASGDGDTQVESTAPAGNEENTSGQQQP